VKHWFESSTTRVFNSAAPKKYAPYTAMAALNEKLSFQVAFRPDDDVDCTVFDATLVLPTGWTGSVRKVGNIPMRHKNYNPWTDTMEELDYEKGGAIPGYVPDALLPETEYRTAPGETFAYWVSVKPGEDAVAGDYDITVLLSAKMMYKPEEPESIIPMKARITLVNAKLEPRHDFHITNWFYVDSLIEWYRLKPFEEKFWEIAEKYIQDYADHGLDTLYVPAFTPPLDGVKRPTQLMKVTKLGEEEWKLDWTDVARWIELAKKCGITHFEWVHPFTQWGVKFAIRIYEGQGEDEKLLWPVETAACSDLYRKFLKLYLGELHDFAVEHGILDKSFFHVSDEPHGEEHQANYTAARNMLKELAPWMKTMDALSEITYGREHLTDMPVPSISTAVQFYKENIESWCYYCCGPRGPYLNRLMDTPLPKIAMHGILFYRWPFKGFLHWGFNYWFKSQTRELIDVYESQDGLKWPGWPYGDTLEVYPGKDGGPVDSIRYEVFSESLQDYRLLQTLGYDRNSKALDCITDFAHFPKDEAWRRRFRKKLLLELAARNDGKTEGK